VDRTFLDPRTGEPVKTLRKGNVYTVVVEGKLQESVENLAVTDLLPAGLELEPIEQKRVRPKLDDVLKPSHVEFRDDRVLLFYTEETSGTFAFVYQVRTVFSGTFSTGPVLIEAMYDPDVRALFRDRDELKVSTE
jgi:uncharacterized protein YfaS (alpha-2-macroglobulin family)